MSPKLGLDRVLLGLSRAGQCNPLTRVHHRRLPGALLAVCLVGGEAGKVPLRPDPGLPRLCLFPDPSLALLPCVTYVFAT